MDHTCETTSCQCASAPSLFGQSLSEMDFEHGVWCAAMDGELQKVKIFLENGGDPNSRDSTGYTALHYSSRSGHEDVCRLLLERGADANAQTRSGKATPLHRAAYCGHTFIMKLLLQHGADPQLCDSDGLTSLHKAAEKQQSEAIRIILKEYPQLVNLTDNKGKKPFFWHETMRDGMVKTLREVKQR